MRLFPLVPLLWMAFIGPMSLSGRAQAERTSDPLQMKLAAEEYDAGRRAYRLGDHLRAAAHFENAFRDAPSPQALRMAIRSRQLAGDIARAATLSARARTRYPEDADTTELVDEVLREAEPQLHKYSVRCEPACVLALNGRLVQEEAQTAQIVYTVAGNHTLVAGWGQRGAQSRTLTSVPSGVSSVAFSVAPSQPPTRPTERHTFSHDRAGASHGWSPLVFAAAAGVTAVLGGVTIWSGLDTLSNPGPNAVRDACVGKGESCTEYQQGQSKERRTNILLVSTGGAAVATAVVGVFFTNWSSWSASRGDNRSTVVLPTTDGMHTVGVTATGQFF